MAGRWVCGCRDNRELGSCGHGRHLSTFLRRGGAATPNRAAGNRAAEDLLQFASWLLSALYGDLEHQFRRAARQRNPVWLRSWQGDEIAKRHDNELLY